MERQTGQELIRHLEGGFVFLFKPEEITEVVSHTYSLIRWAIRDRADMLKLTALRATWLRDDEELGYLPMQPTPTPSHRETLQMILKRDTLVVMHLRLVTETSDVLTYKITYSPEA